MIKIDVKKALQGACGKISLDVCLELESSSFTALGGPSGSGKTSLLRILAGLLKADGFISVDGVVFQDKKTFLPTQKRQIGFSFQDYALFPNLNVEENLLYVKNDKAFAASLLDMVSLSKLAKRRVQTLSGGQKQRVALVRAMMNKPCLLLLDEPLSALDDTLRNKLQNDILKLHERFKTSTIIISHSKEEIKKLASRQIILQNGQVIKDELLNKRLINKLEASVLSCAKEKDYYKLKLLHKDCVFEYKSFEPFSKGFTLFLDLSLVNAN